MLLKVGELARRTGLTVRALHHYDSIGLLRPSARSERGYRLYDRDDVARLHGIQTLRQMGVPLSEMAPLLDGGTPALRAILARQIGALEREIAHRQVLHERLGLLRMVLAAGGQPTLDDWLSSLDLMGAYERHFSAAELRLAFARWKTFEAEWPPLVQSIRRAMQDGLPPDDLQLQPLLGRWIDLSMRWMDGDLAFLGRWSRMLREQPGLPLPAGMDLALLDYVDQALQRRTAVVSRHASPEQLQRLQQTRPEWQALVERGTRLMAEGVPATAPAARELGQAWLALWERTLGDDAAARQRLIAAYESEPLLQAGMPFTPALRCYLEQAAGP